MVAFLEQRVEMFLGSGALNLDGLVAAMTVPGSTNMLGVSDIRNSGLSTSIVGRSYPGHG
ncbi:hypothetical protein [Tolypothrix sp. NIES-4075]|uniref:hypothetical protein n=1 Tax=Tolypothrix sp. NIES-4075 TaxID=2005459 RepID=UPI00190E6B7A|nr:hypothetical protein [Tolypothrix sp. NIES-4075]